MLETMDSYPGCGDSTPEPDPCARPDGDLRVKNARLADENAELLRRIAFLERKVAGLAAELDGPMQREPEAAIQ